MYAWVTLVFNAGENQKISSGISSESNTVDDYVGCAAVLAASLRKFSKYETVCMVAQPKHVRDMEGIDIESSTVVNERVANSRVDDASIEFLRGVFDRVEIVDFLEFPVHKMSNAKTQGIYGNWISKSFTKWRCLSLTKYKKVCFIDADALVVGDIDDVFDLPAPAATFAFPWAEPYAEKSDIYNPYLVNGASPKHGDLIKHTIMRKGLNPPDFAKKSFVPNGAFILLEPSANAFAAYLAYMKATVAKFGHYGHKKCINGFDEQSICAFYCQYGPNVIQFPVRGNVRGRNSLSSRSLNSYSNWHHIGNNYNYYIGKPAFVKDVGDIKLYQFRSTKPQHMKRDEWPDLAKWWERADEVLKMLPEAARWLKSADNVSEKKDEENKSAENFNPAEMGELLSNLISGFPSENTRFDEMAKNINDTLNAVEKEQANQDVQNQASENTSENTSENASENASKPTDNLTSPDIEKLLNIESGKSMDDWVKIGEKNVLPKSSNCISS